MLLALIAIEARQVRRSAFRSSGGRSAISAKCELRHRRDAGSSAHRTLTGREPSGGATSAPIPRRTSFHLCGTPGATQTRHGCANAGWPAMSPVRDDAWGSTDVTRLRPTPVARRRPGRRADKRIERRIERCVDRPHSQQRFRTDDGNEADRTVMGVMLPFEVRPEETVEVEVEVEGQDPRPFARTGYVDDYYFIAQWFPSSACSRIAAGTRISSAPPSSTPITASTTCASPSRASSSWAPPAAARR